MRILTSCDVHVAYHQTYIECAGSEDFSEDAEARFTGQTNGLAGAAVPGGIVLVTGLHTGNVPITIELHDQAPDFDQQWQDAVSSAPSMAFALISGARHSLHPAVTDGTSNDAAGIA